MIGGYYEPEGIRFVDNASRRAMKLVTHGTYRGWLVFWNGDSWVTSRKATSDDMTRLRSANIPIPDDMLLPEEPA